MTKSSSTFAQLLQNIDRNVFARLCKEHKAERHSRGFDSWTQFVAMIFCQFSGATSLSEISLGLSAAKGKLNHIGVREAPKKSTLAYANANRPESFFQAMFYHVLGLTKALAFGKGHKLRIKANLYSIDSTTIDLCLSVFDWAKFRTTKGAIKIHTKLSHNDGYLPDFLVVSDGKMSDRKSLNLFDFKKGSVYVFDKGYNDYKLFDRLTDEGVYFVTRLKENSIVDTLDSTKLNDQVVRLGTGRNQMKNKLRVVCFKPDGEDREFAFLTNNQKWAASTIAAIYKERWRVELFFKSIKQNFRIKSFVGTTKNAVLNQIWTAMIAYLLVRIVQFRAKFGWHFSQLLAMLRMLLFNYEDLNVWIDNPYPKPSANSKIQEELFLRC